MYSRPYDAALPVVCMDESSIQLIGELHIPIPAAPGHSALIDDEYVRNGEPEWTGQTLSVACWRIGIQMPARLFW